MESHSAHWDGQKGSGHGSGEEEMGSCPEPGCGLADQGGINNGEPVIVNSVCQLGWTKAPRCLVKH